MTIAASIGQSSDRSTQSTEEVFRDGYDAFWSGAPISENPYDTEARKYVFWDRGWLQAELETYDE